MAAFSGSFDFRPLPSLTTKGEVGLGFRPVVGRGGRGKKRVWGFGVFGGSGVCFGSDVLVWVGWDWAGAEVWCWIGAWVDFGGLGLGLVLIGAGWVEGDGKSP